MRWGRFSVSTRLQLLATIIVLILVPIVANGLGAPFYTSVVTRILIYAIAASALNLILGYAGLVSFGHALFLGLGVYSVAICSYFGISNAIAHVLLAIVLTGVVGLLVGAASLRTSGIAFIMITLAFAQMGYFVFVGLSPLGGHDGMIIKQPSELAGVGLSSPNVLYAVTLVILIMVSVWMLRMRKAPFGMVLKGTHVNARRITSLGLPVVRYQLVAYVISAVVTGVAGFLLANMTGYASPSTMSWVVSGDLIVMVVLGGLGTVMGPIYGTFVFLLLEEALRAYTDHWMIILGPFIVLVAIARYWRPRQWLVRVRRWRSARRPTGDVSEERT